MHPGRADEDGYQQKNPPEEIDDEEKDREIAESSDSP